MGGRGGLIFSGLLPDYLPGERLPRLFDKEGVAARSAQGIPQYLLENVKNINVTASALKHYTCYPNAGRISNLCHYFTFNSSQIVLMPAPPFDIIIAFLTIQLSRSPYQC